MGRTLKLKPLELTKESFTPYGQIVSPSADGEAFGSESALLDLSRGIPRFYIMHIEDRGLVFDRIAHHARVTQCLGSVGARDWYLGVARPSVLPCNEEDASAMRVNNIENPSLLPTAPICRAKAGHFYLPPSPQEVVVFKIDGPRFIKLNAGTWHAGPFFKGKAMDFYNLELSDTNVR